MGTNKGFTGQYADATGLDYYNAKYYDPVAGVFLLTDTVQGNAKGMNPYGYVGGNPETKNDPTGKMIVGNNGNFGSIAPDGSLTIVTNAYAGWVWDHLTPTEIHRPIYNPNTDSNNSPLAKFSHMTGWTDFQHVWNDPHASWQDKLTALMSLVGTNANNLFQLAMILGGGEEEGAALGGKTLVQDVADLCGGGLSFTADTKVATAHGEQAIGKLHVGDKVWAYNPSTHKMELEPVQHVWLNHDHDLVDLTVATTVPGPHGKASQHDEVIHTNERHPFLTKEKGFVPVSQLGVGMHIRQADGSYGAVVKRMVVPGAKWMYNLEVAQDHTFTVGDGQWVVHNSNCGQVFSDLTNAGYKVTTHFMKTFTQRASGLTVDDVIGILQNGEHFYDTQDFNFVAVSTVQGKGLFRIAYDSGDMWKLLSIAGKRNGAADIIGNWRRFVPPGTIIPDWINPFR